MNARYLRIWDLSTLEHKLSSITETLSDFWSTAKLSSVNSSDKLSLPPEKEK